MLEEIRKSGKQSNVSMIAFTATPKPDTLQLFGTLNAEGKKESFDLYSMRQAIEEGYILNVLDNYVTWRTYCHINKAIESDPELQSITAKRKMARFIDLHDTNIAQKVEIIIEHFRANVAGCLDGKANDMQARAAPKSALGRAIHYLLEQWPLNPCWMHIIGKLLQNGWKPNASYASRPIGCRQLFIPRPAQTYMAVLCMKPRMATSTSWNRI